MSDSGPLRASAGELTADEILAALEAGRRVIVTVELLGSVTEVALRRDGETFYCDTPTRLHRHSDPDEMRACIERMGYGKVADGPGNDADGSGNDADGWGDEADGSRDDVHGRDDD